MKYFLNTFLLFCALLTLFTVAFGKKSDRNRGNSDESETRGRGSQGHGHGHGQGHGHGHDSLNRSQSVDIPSEEGPTPEAIGENLDNQQSSGPKKDKKLHQRLLSEVQQLGDDLVTGANKELKKMAKTLDTKGSLKAVGKKVGKKFRRNNRTKTYMYKGKLVTMNATTRFDLPPINMTIANFSRLPRFGKACKTQAAPNRTSSATDDVNRGPAADGLTVDHFKPCQERKRGSRKNRQKADGSEHRREKRAETYSSISWLWPDPENIPIIFDKTYTESYRAGGRQAWQYWQNHSCLRFVEKPTGTVMTQPHIFLSISGTGACSTDRLGPAKFTPFRTTIDVTQCKNLTGSIAHEIGHALGLSHSQKRVDRDGAINVNLKNIASSWHSQFERDNDKQFDEWGVPYYYDSIMHYYPYAATANGLMTICPLDPIMEAVMGQREEPAFGDISLINRIYCQENCFNKSEFRSLNFTGALSMTISGRICQNWATQTPHKHRYASVGNHDYCRNPDNWTGGPWCYTTDPAVPYEPCFAACEDLAKLNKPFCRGWCYHGGYHNPDDCKCVCPKYATGPYCQTLDMSVKHAHVPCGGQFLLKKGIPIGISSPNWPHNYTTEDLCVWWIQAPENMKVRANVSDFLMEIPDESGCYDYLEIRKSICAATEQAPEDMRFCGNSLAPDPLTNKMKSVMSTDRNLVLKFVTDDHENARGFSIIVEAV